MISLKPCPFCGDDPSMVTHGGTETHGYRNQTTIASRCGISLSRWDKGEKWVSARMVIPEGQDSVTLATQAWNTRAEA